MAAEFFLHTYPARKNIPHDFIDPLNPDAQTEKIYAQLAGWLMGEKVDTSESWAGSR